MLLHGDYRLAASLRAYGVHLQSSQLLEIPQAKALGLYTIVSTHSTEEALRAQTLGADAVTYSPIFYKKDKGAPKGIEALQKLVVKLEIDVFALGGIVDEAHIAQLQRVEGLKGFAAIRYFMDGDLK